MRKESLEFLRALVETGGPSGYEQPVQRLFGQYVRDFAEDVRVDVMGNSIAVANGSGAPRVMLWTAEHNVAAQRLFEARGFRRTMIEMTRELVPAGSVEERQ